MRRCQKGNQIRARTRYSIVTVALAATITDKTTVTDK